MMLALALVRTRGRVGSAASGNPGWMPPLTTVRPKLRPQPLLRLTVRDYSITTHCMGTSSLARSHATADWTACAFASAPAMAWPSPSYSSASCSVAGSAAPGTLGRGCRLSSAASHSRPWDGGTRMSAAPMRVRVGAVTSSTDEMGERA
eukprot:scaffold12543_cov115-Isochrysis_galbana.AAC.12